MVYLCAGKTNKGTPCKVKRCKGFKYCFNHKNQDPDYTWIACIADTRHGKRCTQEAKVRKLCTKHANLATIEKITEKKCNVCGTIKPLDDFGKNSKSREGRLARCKECINSKQRILNYSRKESGTNKCTSCGKIKHVSQFGRGKRNINGLNIYCFQCIAEKSSSLLVFIHNRCGEARRRAEKHVPKREYSITEDDVMKLWEEEKYICRGTGYMMTHIKIPSDPTNFYRVSLEHYYNMSIDRRNTELGYTKENIQLVTMAYNLIKGELDEKFLHNMCRFIFEYDGTSDKVKISSTIEQFIKGKLNETLHDLPKRFRKIKLDITREDLYTKFEKQGGLCALSGLIMTTFTSHKLRPLKERKYRYEENYLNISIDRIDSLKDYTTDNVQLICSCVNMMKGEMSQDMFIEFCKTIAKTHSCE